MPPSLRYHGAAIAFLHTAAVHIDTFDALRDQLAPGLALTHAVREDLLCATEKAGGLTAAVSDAWSNGPSLCCRRISL